MPDEPDAPDDKIDDKTWYQAAPDRPRRPEVPDPLPTPVPSPTVPPASGNRAPSGAKAPGAGENSGAGKHSASLDDSVDSAEADSTRVAPPTIQPSFVNSTEPNAKTTGSSQDSDGGKDSADSDDSDGRAHDGSTNWDLSPPPLIQPGEIVFQKYRLIQQIGEGGMGQVWLVHNLALDRKSALKLIKPEIARNDRGWKRFRREAQLMAKLSHPNAVAVYDFKRTQSMGYIEMEYIRGKSLDKVLEEQNGIPLTLEWVANMLDQLCAVLHEAHSHVDENSDKPKPIIHRDLKPSNLMLVDKKQENANLRVLDFGIAKMIDDDDVADTQLTGAGEFLGTVGYSSPEQIRGGLKKEDKNDKYDIDGRSDIYSTGILLYQFLTGVLPFRGGRMSILAAHLIQTPPVMKEANPQSMIPIEVERLVRRCLEKDPNKRPQTARSLAESFRIAAKLTPLAVKKQHKLLLYAARLATAGLVLAAISVLAWKFVPAWPSPAKLDPVEQTKLLPEKQANSHVSISKEERAKSKTTKIWEPPGYHQVLPKGTVAGSTGLPTQLMRDADESLFDYYKDGVYLPVGYEAEDPSSTKGDWPSILVRKTDGKRFIRIQAKVFRCGDCRRAVAVDESKNALTPYYVLPRSFYIQETEVTNAEIEDYLERYPDEGSKLSHWRKYYDEEKSTNPKFAEHFPAVGMSYIEASKFARDVYGRLPTEAEWEFVAKSGVDEYLYVWGEKSPTAGEKPWARLFDSLQTVPFPAAVKHYKKDRTSLGVFDMTGNVREWCLNAYKPYKALIPALNSQDNPVIEDPWIHHVGLNAIDPKKEFVVRGGSLQTELEQAMVFQRGKEVAGIPDLGDLGFRVAIECPPQPGKSERDL